MNRDRDISIYVKDMLDSMKRIEKFTKGTRYADFAKDEKTSFATLRCIEVIGEAAKHVPEHIRKKHPEIPWKDIAGMRDKISHFYFGVNLERVWLAIKEDIPQIKPHLIKVLKELKRGG